LNSGAAAAVFCGSGFGLSWAPETITVTVAASTDAAYEKNRRRTLILTIASPRGRPPNPGPESTPTSPVA